MVRNARTSPYLRILRKKAKKVLDQKEGTSYLTGPRKRPRRGGGGDQNFIL